MTQYIKHTINWREIGQQLVDTRSVGANTLALVVIFAIFYLSTYFSVSFYPPVSVPVHHDDYSNYASGGGAFTWSWIRPLSTYAIYLLAKMGPDWVIGGARFLTGLYVYLVWQLLCEFCRPRYYWLTLVLFSALIFSAPIAVEYARYTGVITHMMSGCLGLVAVIFLFRSVASSANRVMIVSAVFLILSALAKEDFIFFYAISLVYIALFLKPDNPKKIIGWGVGGLVVSFLSVTKAKFTSASSFLGVMDSSSTYYIDTSVVSVVKTVLHYLTGASHPAMHSHGLFVFGMICFSFLVVMILYARNSALPKTAYFIVAVFCLIAPYSILPNHVNAYYEFIWLPLILAGTFMALTELSASLAKDSAKYSKQRIPISVFFILALTLSIFDYSGRKSVAAWYDSVMTSNAITLEQLQAQKTEINQLKNVCITGADSFSPWYLHGGQYLRNVMGLNATWYIFMDSNSPYNAGMLMGANASNKHSVVVSTNEHDFTNCLYINLKRDL